MNFDRIARSYFFLEKVAFGGELQRTRVALLDEIKTAKRVLIVGEGDGRFLVEFAHRFPSATIDCVDASARMVALARRRVRENPRLNFFCADFADWPGRPEKYDLIVTHFFLDCFHEQKLADIVRRLASYAADGAQWLLADFCLPEKGFARWRAEILLAIMYRFFRFTARIEANHLADASPFLEAEGAVLAQRKSFWNGILKSECWLVRPSANERSKPDFRP